MDHTVRVSPLEYISAVVPSPERAAELLDYVFAAPRLSDDGSDGSTATCDIGMGDTVVRFVAGATADPALAARFEREGAFVHSLAYEVDDLARATTLLEAEGIRAEGANGPDSARDGESLLFDTSAKLGFSLELRQSGQTEMIGATGGNPAAAPYGDLSPLLHIELVTEDLDDTAAFLSRVFGSVAVETDFSGFLSSFGALDVVHLGLGRTVLQYCKPVAPGTSWHALLARRGRSVHNITWLVPNMAEVYYAYRGAGVVDIMDTHIPFGELFGHDNVPATLGRAHITDTIATLGFGLELTENFAANMDAYLHNPISDWSRAKAYQPRMKQAPTSMVSGTDGIGGG